MTITRRPIKISTAISETEVVCVFVIGEKLKTIGLPPAWIVLAAHVARPLPIYAVGKRRAMVYRVVSVAARVMTNE